MKSLLILSILCLSLFSYANENDCNILVDDNFPTSKFDQKLVSSINFLANTKGDMTSSLHYIFFGGNVSGETYCDYLKSKIKNIEYFDFNGEWALARNNWGSIQMSETLLRDFDTVQIASVLIHEAFHSNYGNGYNGHVICPETFPIEKYRGIEACDDQAFSSYGAQYTWAMNLLKSCSNCTQSEKKSLEKVALWGIERIISDSAKKELVEDIESY